METQPSLSVDSNSLGDLPQSPIDPTNAILIGQARHVLTVGAGVLVTKGWMDSSFADLFIAVGLAIGAMIWSAFEKSGQAKVVNAAIANLLTLLPQPHPLVGPDANGQAQAAAKKFAAEPIESAPSPLPAPATPVGGVAGHASVDTLLCLVIFTAALAFILGCTTTQRNAVSVGAAKVSAALNTPTAHAIEQQAVTIGLQLAISALSHGNMDSAWSSPTALNSISSDVANVGIETGAALIQSSLAKFSAGNPQVAAVSQDLASAYVATTPATPTAKAAAVVSLATGLSKGLALKANASNAVREGEREHLARSSVHPARVSSPLTHSDGDPGRMPASTSRMLALPTEHAPSDFADSDFLPRPYVVVGDEATGHWERVSFRIGEPTVVSIDRDDRIHRNPQRLPDFKPGSDCRRTTPASDNVHSTLAAGCDGINEHTVLP